MIIYPTVDDLDAYAFLLGLYETGKLRFQELEAWLRQHAKPILPTVN